MGLTHLCVLRSRRPDMQSWASSQRCPRQWLTMPSWTQHPGQHGLQGVGLHRGPWEPEEAPEPQRGEGWQGSLEDEAFELSARKE